MRQRTCCKARVAFRLVVMILLDNTLNAARIVPRTSGPQRARHRGGSFTQLPHWKWHANSETVHQNMASTTTTTTVYAQQKQHGESLVKSSSFISDLKEKFSDQMKIEPPPSIGSRLHKDPGKNLSSARERYFQTDTISSPVPNSDNEIIDISSYGTASEPEQRTMGAFDSLSAGDFNQSLINNLFLNNQTTNCSREDTKLNLHSDNSFGGDQSTHFPIIPVPGYVVKTETPTGSPLEDLETSTTNQLPRTTESLSPFNQLLRKKRTANPSNISDITAPFGDLSNLLDSFLAKSKNDSDMGWKNLANWLFGSRNETEQESKHLNGNDSDATFSSHNNDTEGHGFHKLANETESGGKQQDMSTKQSSLATLPTTTTTTTEAVLSTEPPLHIISGDISNCFQQEDDAEILATTGSITLHSQAFINGTAIRPAVCTMNIPLPPGHAMELKVHFRGECDDLLVFAWEVHSGHHRKLFDICAYRLSSEQRLFNIRSYSSPSATVSFNIQLMDTTVPFLSEDEKSTQSSFYIVIEFSTFTDLQKLLDVTFATPLNGSVMTRGWDGVTSSIMCMDTWVTLPVPESHVVMVSMYHINMPGTWIRCSDAAVGLYADPHFNKQLQVFCGNTIPGPASYTPETGKLYVRFYHAWNAVPTLGFKLLFSFHPVSAQLPLLSHDRWNCSVSRWADFQHHFPCNLKAECAGLEDEAACPYTTSHCGPGRITIRDRCYMKIQVWLIGFYTILQPQYRQNQTWNNAEDTCRRVGARLASLGSFRERQEVVDVIFRTDSPSIFIGMVHVEVSAPYIYKDMWQHLDGTIAHDTAPMTTEGHRTSDSIVFDGRYQTKIQRDVPYLASTLCELPTNDRDSAALNEVGNSVHLASVNWQGMDSEGSFFVTCPGSHVTHSFLACDEHSHCWDMSTSGFCSAPLTPLPPSFTCMNGVQFVPYTLVCDHHADCSDRSDEQFCIFASCDVSTQFKCSNQECVSLALMCDEVPNCRDASDEEQCGWIRKERDITQTTLPPALLTFDGHGGVVVHALNDTRKTLSSQYNQSLEVPTNSFSTNLSSAHDREPSMCPDTHFQCADNGFCLPVFVRCSNLYDCPGHEDELDCDSYTCPGFYRCRGSYSCVHQSELCDGIYQCPQRDDELLCDFTCPHNCTCFGLAFTCRGDVHVEFHPHLRYLDASGSNLKYLDVAPNAMLVYLNLARCGIADLSPVDLPNLQNLDLSANSITTITEQHLSLLPNLRHLSLAKNPVSLVFSEKLSLSTTLTELVSLDLTDVHLPELNASVLGVFPDLHILNLSQCGVVSVLADGFKALSELRTVDLRGSPLEFFPQNIFEGLEELQEIFSENNKLCCPATLPSRFNPANCKAPSNEISSCEVLLRSDVYRCFLSIFAVLAIVGNLVSLLARIFVKKCHPKMGFDVFVTSLCISDLLMGVYLAIIGVADRVYLGTYLWNDVVWRNSSACKVAGVLSMLSCGVSAIIICLITMDRFLVLQFPFSKFHFNRKQAVFACVLTWVAGLVIASVPLLPWTPRWEFYSQTGICIPLPINGIDFVGENYAFGIMIVFNFVLFVVIAVGQIFIYWSVKRNKFQPITSGGNDQKEFIVSQRLVVIAVSDFLCWFPIGILGLLASRGVPIDSEVNVAITIMVLPINSANNPFLYTLNILFERFRLQREQRLQQFLLARMISVTGASNVVASHHHCNQDEALQIFKRWINKGILSRETATRYLIGKETQPRPGPKSVAPAQASHVLSAVIGCSPLLQGVEGGSSDQQCCSPFPDTGLCPQHRHFKAGAELQVQGGGDGLHLEDSSVRPWSVALGRRSSM